MAKLHVKKGDNVMVIAGNNKGQSGRVLNVDKEKQRAIVEGVNMISKHTRPNADNPKGGIVKQEASVHISNLMVMDKSGKPTRIGRKKDEKTGKSVRISNKSGEVIK
ncbi:MAG: 50S ribosomal protein L24 [Bacteroidetes bacterium]|nr:MAG: 50S ribosomal protein L24 [Bacteroidota bacterium]RLD44828.1 MAG: 50S ribosomal protein L24 [Bacteroidota bacterium]RLD74580.1 MAG: 50S ribosomal protein L24 [Bacteroidota bacterium]RLD89650.1 MAG: 50S ribosomal protein L24 [Bacteroidota bacterium]